MIWRNLAVVRSLEAMNNWRGQDAGLTLSRRRRYNVAERIPFSLCSNNRKSQVLSADTTDGTGNRTEQYRNDDSKESWKTLIQGAPCVRMVITFRETQLSFFPDKHFFFHPVTIPRHCEGLSAVWLARTPEKQAIFKRCVVVSHVSKAASERC